MEGAGSQIKMAALMERLGRSNLIPRHFRPSHKVAPRYASVALHAVAETDTCVPRHQVRAGRQ